MRAYTNCPGCGASSQAIGPDEYYCSKCKETFQGSQMPDAMPDAPIDIEELKSIEADKIKTELQHVLRDDEQPYTLAKLGIVAQIQKLNSQRLEKAFQLQKIRVEKLQLKDSMNKVERVVAAQVQAIKLPGKTKQRFSTASEQKRQVEAQVADNPDYVQWMMRMGELQNVEEQLKDQVEWLKTEISIWTTFLKTL
jgi:hypothetical protein